MNKIKRFIGEVITYKIMKINSPSAMAVGMNKSEWSLMRLWRNIR